MHAALCVCDCGGGGVHTRRTWSAGDVLILDLGAGYMGIHCMKI